MSTEPFRTRSGEALIERGRDEFDDPIYGSLNASEEHWLWEREVTQEDLRADYYDREGAA